MKCRIYRLFYVESMEEMLNSKYAKSAQLKLIKTVRG